MTNKMLPAGAMIELNLAQINEGDLLREINAQMATAHRELQSYREATGAANGVCKVGVELAFSYDPDMKDHVVVTHSVKLAVPARTNKVIVKESGGKLLCQPTGADGKSPDQMRLFDAKGNPIGMFDEEDGFVPASDVAGKIAKA